MGMPGHVFVSACIFVCMQRCVFESQVCIHPGIGAHSMMERGRKGVIGFEISAF